MYFSRIIPHLIIIAALVSGCSFQESEPDAPDDFTGEDDHYQFTVSVQNHNGEPLIPAGLYVYRPETGRERAPIASFSDESNGLITVRLEKGTPAVVRVHAAYHQPLYLFLPSFSGDQLSATIQPVSFIIPPDAEPRVLGNFNHYDDFSAQPLELLDDGTWHTVIENDLDSLTYILDGFSEIMKIHGTGDRLAASPTHTATEPGIESVQENDGSNRFEIIFDPAQFPSEERDAAIRFDDDTPVMISGIAKVYSSMIRMADKIQVLNKRGQTITESHLDGYLDRLHQIADGNDHPKVELASRLAKANFSDFLNPDDEWIDRLMDDIDPNSELWLMHYPVISELFTHSSRMEDVSRSLWDVYRQHGHETVRGEALYNLLKFHYERGEDEEWYQAHFDLVREYPDHPRINYSYWRGYAPDAVVHVGRYFPDLSFEPLHEGREEIIPSQNDAPLTILSFWDINDQQNQRFIRKLLDIHDQYAGLGLEIYTVAINGSRERIQRFHEHHQIPWQGGYESLSSPAVQVLGITEMPFTVIINRENRVIIIEEDIFEEAEAMQMIEDYLRNVN